LLVSQKQRAKRALDVLNFVLADVRYGLGPYGVVYLVAAHGWSEVDIAFAYIFGSIAGLVTQTPVGAMVDAVRAKRALAASALAVVAFSCFAIPFAPTIAPVAAAGVAGALANSTLGMTIAAISLGVVGPEDFPRRAARNEAFFHAGSAVINVAVLALTPIFGIAVVFWLLAGAAVASIVAICAVPAEAINHDAARGLVPQNKERARSSLLRTLMESKPLMAFAGCGALFHMANASMLGLVVQRYSSGQGRGCRRRALGRLITASDRR
jgi:MFS family permease